jgi:hypothetical protein
MEEVLKRLVNKNIGVSSKVKTIIIKDGSRPEAPNEDTNKNNKLFW